jgi:tricarballylate dehydrogenase
VRILERSPEAERGGNSRYTGGNLKMDSVTEVAADLPELLSMTSETFVHHSLIQLTAKPYEEWPPILRAYGFADPELINALVSNAPEATTWLTSAGVRLELISNPASGVNEMETVGGGIAAIEGLLKSAEDAGATLHYETAARSLITDDDGKVLGVSAWSPNDGRVEFYAKAVIIASGGFEGNQEMGSRYFGAEAYRLRTTSRGGMYNKGEGIEMALAIGAAPAGEYGGFHAMICDPRSVNTESVKPWNYGILVNKRGKRFIDEGSDAREMISDTIGKAILKQPDGIAYFVYDEKIKDVSNYESQIGSELGPITAGSIEELAKKIDVPAETLTKTIAAFNAGVQTGTFIPVTPDGVGTIGVEPPKSNWARAIDGPQFMAYPMVCTNVFTFGGLRISPTTNVVNTEGYEIPGLYAAGETVGLYYGYYASGSSYFRGLVFGRIAGKQAAGLAENS